MGAATRRAALLGAALLGLAACETTAGFGRDVETAGVAIQRSVAESRQPLALPPATAVRVQPLPPAR